MEELKINIPVINFDEIEKPSAEEITRSQVKEPTKKQEESDEPIGLNLSDSSNTKNSFLDNEYEEEDDDEEETEQSLESLSTEEAAAEELYQEGYFTELPDDIDTENFSFQDFVKTVKHNFELQKQREEEIKSEAANVTFEKIVSKMSPLTQQLFEYELKGGEEANIVDLAKSIIYSNDIKSLTTANVRDQERIVKEYYKSTGDSSQEIEERIKDLASANLLEKEAIRLKPKLDAKADEIAQEKARQQELLYNQERDNKKKLETKVLDTLKAGNLDGIPLDQEMASFLFDALMNDEVPMRIKGKQVEVSVAEAMIRYHKYHDKGNVAHLMKALYFLHDPEKFESYYKKQVTTKESERMIKENRISSSSKSGKFVTSEPKKTTSAPLNNRFLNTTRK